MVSQIYRTKLQLTKPILLILKKKVRQKSVECHNHKPQPNPDRKRKRKHKTKQAEIVQMYEIHSSPGVVIAMLKGQKIQEKNKTKGET